MTLSVVVVTWNRRDELLALLGDLSHQSEPADEIILVDNGSEDGTVEAVAARFPAAETVRLPVNTGLSNGRNVGIARARSDLVVVLDNDIRVLDGDLFRRVRASVAEHADCGIISFHCSHGLWGPDAPPAGARLLPLEELERLAASGRSPVTPRAFYDWFFWGGACAIRREVFAAVGGFDRDFGYGGEEWDFAMRCHAAGVRLLRDESLWVVHVRSPSMRADVTPQWIFTNMVLAQARYLPLADLIVFLAVQLTTSAVGAVRRRRLRGYLRAVAQIAGSWASQVSAKRRPVNRRAMRRLYYLRTHRPTEFEEVERARCTIWDYYRSRLRRAMEASEQLVLVPFRGGAP